MKKRQKGLVLAAGALGLVLVLLLPQAFSRAACHAVERLWGNRLFASAQEHTPLELSIFLHEEALVRVLQPFVQELAAPMRRTLEWVPGIGRAAAAVVPELRLSRVELRAAPAQSAVGAERGSASSAVMARVRLTMEAPGGGLFATVAPSLFAVMDFPLEMVHGAGGTVELKSRLSAATVVEVGIEGFVGTGAVLSEWQARARQELERILGMDVVLARIPPLRVEEFQIDLQPLRLEAIRDTNLLHIVLQASAVEVPRLPALPPPTLTAELPVAVALHELGALALSDHALRVHGASGFRRNGAAGGPYRVRLRSLETERDQTKMEMVVLRHRWPCGWATMSAALTFRRGTQGVEVVAQDLELQDANRPLCLVRAMMPGEAVLGDRATEMLQQALRMEDVQLGELGRVSLLGERVETRQAVIYAHARLHVQR